MAKTNISITLENWACNKLDEMTKTMQRGSFTDWNRSKTIEYLIRKLNPVEYLQYVAKQKSKEFYAAQQLLESARDVQQQLEREGKIKPTLEQVSL